MMYNVKHYPTHPGAEHPPIMTCEIPQMSELKAKHVVDVYDEYSANPYNEAQVYLKSEADREIRKQKRKRCLAMAEKCRTKAALADLFSPKRTSRKFICWKNRYEKFLELADKFKE